MIDITIDGTDVRCWADSTVLEAARVAGIYIPTLCSHPDLVPTGSCRLCIVQIEGVRGYPTSCSTPVSQGLKVVTNSEELAEMRRDILSLLLERHPHACLNCAQREGCTREPCSTNVPVDERCCPLFGNCEFQRVVEYVGMREDTPKYVPKQIPMAIDEPLYERNRNLCILCGRCVSACADLRGVGVIGFIERGFETYVGTAYDGSLADSDCRFCGACVEVCPTGALTDRDVKSGGREETLVPCKHTCPAGIDIPRFIYFITRKDYNKAAAVLRSSVPLANVLGHICYHPCEGECRRGKLNDPVSIRELQRFAASRGDVEGYIRPMDLSRGKKVAVIGSGPAGLTGAYFLALKGYDVTVFEENDEPGGVLRELIPEYRLPRAVLNREIGMIEDIGVKFVTGTRINSPLSLKVDGYDAVFVAVGAWEDIPLDIPGGDSENVVPSLEYLGKSGVWMEMTARRVAVVGTGHALVESARKAVRNGAEEVLAITYMSRDGSGMFSGEIAKAVEEGIDFLYDTRLESIELADGGGGGINIRCNGPSGVEKRNVDIVVNATGTRPRIPEDLGLPLDAGGRIVVNPTTMAAGVRGIYAGGDAVSAAYGAVDAVEAGKKAAGNIDIFLGGDGNIDFEFVEAEEPDPRLGMINGFAYLPRVANEIPAAAERLHSNAPDSFTFDEKRASDEALRCLRCDLRLQLREVPHPPERWLELDGENVSGVPAAEGVYQLLDEEKNILAIKGCWNLREELMEKLDSGTNARYFTFEEEQMYSKRENEMLQVFMQKHGCMPPGDGGEDDLDDLF